MVRVLYDQKLVRSVAGCLSLFCGVQMDYKRNELLNRVSTLPIRSLMGVVVVAELDGGRENGWLRGRQRQAPAECLLLFVDVPVPRVRAHLISVISNLVPSPSPSRSTAVDTTCSHIRPLKSVITHHVSRTAAGASSDAFEPVPKTASRSFGGGRGETAFRCTIGRERAGQESVFISYPYTRVIIPC